MLAAESPAALHLHRPKPGFRKPLQPKNVILPSPNPIPNDPKKCGNNNNIVSVVSAEYGGFNKENCCRGFVGPIEALDASLAEELTAVRMRMERLRLDKEKTEKLLQDRDKLLDFQLYELQERGEFQRELEIEVDRLFRLKQLHLASMRMSPIRSLRDKEMEKKSQQLQSESTKSTGEVKEEIVDESCNTESTSLSLESTSASTTTSSSVSTSNSTATSKMSMILPRLSLESSSNKGKI